MHKKESSTQGDMPVQDAISYLLKQVKTLGADAADIIAMEGADVSIAVREGKTETVQRAESSGIGLRVLVGKRQAMVSVSDRIPQNLKNIAEQAVAMAKVVPEDPFVQIAEEALWVKKIPELDLYDAYEPPVELLSKAAIDTENAAVSVPGITNTEGAEAGYGSSQVWLANSFGFSQHYRTSFSSLSVSVLAGSGEAMERDYAYHSVRHYHDLKSPQMIGKEAADRTLARLNPRQPKTGNVPVIFDPRVAKSIVGILISAINGASIARGTSFLKDALGQSVFPAGISIINDPHRIRGIGSRPFDAEGLPCQKWKLIEDGKLTNWLMDLRSANQLGLKSTGNASRGLGSAPSPSSHNVYMENGTITPKEMIAQVKEGFYVTETFGSGVNLITGDYSQGAAGFWIENGQFAGPVSELTIAGNLREMFKTILPANDLVFEYQTNAPTLRIDGMMLAGKS
jgi:PmbA protein